MSRIVFALDELVEEILRIDPQAGPVTISLRPQAFEAVAGEIANQMSGRLVANAREVDMGKVIIRAVHG